MYKMKYNKYIFSTIKKEKNNYKNRLNPFWTDCFNKSLVMWNCPTQGNRLLYIRIFHQEEKNADICSTLIGQCDYLHNLLRNVWNSRLIQIALLNSVLRRNRQYMHLMSSALWLKWIYWEYSSSFLLNVSVCRAGAEIRIEKWLRVRICDEGKRPEKCQLRLLSLSV